MKNEIKEILKAMIREQAITPERAEIDFNIAVYLLENGIQRNSSIDGELSPEDEARLHELYRLRDEERGTQS